MTVENSIVSLGNAGTNRRREPRIPVSHAGVVATESAIYDCELLDLSSGGARLQFDKPVFIRGTFELVVEDVLCENCIEIWRSERQMGVSFRRAA